MEDQGYPKKAKTINKNFYALVKRRKDKLVRQMLGSQKGVVTSFTPKQEKLSHFLKEAEKYCDQFEKKTRIDKDQYWIDLNYKGERCYLPFLCFQFFEVFCAMERCVERFVYFEIYFSGGIFSALMRKDRFSNGNEGFGEFDMGRREWLLAKAQMTFWQGFVRPKSDVIPYLSLPQQTLLQYFSPVRGNKLIELLKSAEENQIKIEKKQEMIPDFLPSDVNKKSKKKARKLKDERLRILSQLESAETDHIRSLLRYEGLDTVWSIIAYVTMLGAAPLMEASYSPQFLLNICLDEVADGLLSAMQTLISAFVLQRYGAIAEEISYSHAGKTIAPQRQKHLPQIILYDKPGQLTDVFRELEDRQQSIQNGSTDELYAEQLPILMGTTWIADSRVANLQISSGDIIAAVQDKESLIRLRELIDYVLYGRVSLQWKNQKIVLNGDEVEPKEQWNAYKERLYKALSESWNGWSSWWSEQKITLLSPQYINLAAWFALLLSSDIGVEPEENGLLAGIQASVRRMEGELSDRLETLRAFIRAVLNEYELYPEKRPDGEDAVKQMEKPLRMSFKDNKGNTEPHVVFTKELFSRYANQAASGIDAEKLAGLAYSKGLLSTNSAEGDRTKTVKMGKRTDDPKKDYAVRCYALNVKKAKEYINS